MHTYHKAVVLCDVAAHERKVRVPPARRVHGPDKLVVPHGQVVRVDARRRHGALQRLLLERPVVPLTNKPKLLTKQHVRVVLQELENLEVAGTGFPGRQQVDATQALLRVGLGVVVAHELELDHVEHVLTSRILAL